jgi:hypothetical protein
MTRRASPTNRGNRKGAREEERVMRKTVFETMVGALVTAVATVPGGG